MSEPRTEAGKRLLAWWSANDDLRDAILAIEAEAAGAPSEGLREAVVAALAMLQRGATWDARDRLYAALAAVPSVAPSEGGLDAAWAEAEAALPEGWIMSVGLEGGQCIARAGAEKYEWPPAVVTAVGAWPAAALRALRARLRQP